MIFPFCLSTCQAERYVGGVLRFAEWVALVVRAADAALIHLESRITGNMISDSSGGPPETSLPTHSVGCTVVSGMLSTRVAVFYWFMIIPP